MEVNKVEANGETLIDLTNDTVQASDVLKGKTLHLASGVQVEGTYDHDSKQDTFVNLWEAEGGSEGINNLDIDALSDLIDNYSALIVTISNESDDSETVSTPCTLASAYCHLSYAFRHGEAPVFVPLSLQPTTEHPSIRNVLSWIFMDQTAYDETPKHIYVLATRDPSVSPSFLTGLYLRRIVGIPISGWKFAVISGYMPLNFLSNGDALTSYRIYGTADGAGERTKNIFEIIPSEQIIAETGTLEFTTDAETGTITANGTTGSTESYVRQRFTVTPELAGRYYFSASFDQTSPSFTFRAYMYNLGHGWTTKWDGTTRSPAIIGDEYQEVLLVEGYTVEITFNVYANKTVDNIVCRPMLRKAGTTPDFIPYGYQVPLTITNGTETKETIIPIGDTKLMAGEYISYKTTEIFPSGKIYKAKRIHEDTVTIDGIEWDILDYDHDEVYKSDGTRAKHTVTIQTHDLIDTLQYSARQAAFAFPNGLVAGTYHFTVGAHPWVASDVNKVLTFTLVNAIPAGGQLVFNGAHNRTLVGTTISVFASATDTTAAETVTMTEGDTGTDLGTMLRSKTDTVNSIDRAMRGSNNWLESAMRQYLNSDKAAGNVWTPQTAFDRPPAWATTTAGFLNGKSNIFISHIGTAKKTTGRNSISDGGGTAVNDEKLFLLSRSEVFMGDEYTGGEGTPYAYYKNYSDNQSPSTGEDKNRIKYHAGGARNWWLRSPIAGYASSIRLVYSSGAWIGHDAVNVFGVAPACCIILDDMDDWVKQTFYTETTVDLPAIEPFEGINTLDSTVEVGEVTIKGKIKH